MLDLQTVNDVFLRATGRGSQTVILWQNAAGEWLPISSSELGVRVRQLAGVLRHWGVQRGDRVAIIAENRWEWPVVDFATLAIGAVDVPLYPTLTPEQFAYMLRDSGAQVAFVSSLALYQKIASIAQQTQLEHVVLMDEDAAEGAEHMSALLTMEGVALTQEEVEQCFQAVHADDLATIIYTSGTTGESKGVMLTHGNIASNINHATTPFGFSPEHSCISFLPLSHITARALDYALFSYGATLAYCPKFDRLVDAMKQVRPTILVAVPRVYEKIRQAVEVKSAGSPVRSRLLAWALRVGRSHRDEVLRGEVPSSPMWKLAHKLVLSKISAAFGGRIVYFISGGAPLGMDTAGWFADAGMRIFEGYGLTETSPVISLNIPDEGGHAHRIGSVGKPLANVECRIAPDGELEVRGPSVFKGYWNKPEATAESFTMDGWFKTGDIARIDDDGFLYITDRKKELLKTSGGKLIAPQPIENKLKANLLVGQATLVGDKHKFVCALISPNFAALEAWAHAQGIVFGSRGELVEQRRVIAEYKSIVEKVNATLANFESIKRVKVVADEWGVESGELTPSMKLKRRVINQRYAVEISAFYYDEATAHKATIAV